MKNDQWPPLLREAQAEVEGAKERLFAALYTELHQLAERPLRRSARDSISPTTLLESTRWNFAWLAAARFDLGTHDKVLELGIRHWSNAWIRAPNRGENFLALSLGF